MIAHWGKTLHSNFEDMSRTIDLPDPLYAEIHGYAARVAVPPLVVIRQAWDEFRRRHENGTQDSLVAKPTQEELFAMVSSMTGSLPLPQDADYDNLRQQSLTEKHGAL